MGSCFDIVLYILWLYSLEYNSIIFEYMIVHEIESPTTARLTRGDEMT